MSKFQKETKRNPLKPGSNLRPRGMHATDSQINKLLVMLHTDGLIGAGYDKYEKRWEYEIPEAVEWVQREMGFAVDELEQLTHGQIGACFEELGG